MIRRLVLSSAILVLAAACSGKSAPAQDTKAEEPAKTDTAAKADDEATPAVNAALLDPFEANEKAPDTYRVKLDTTKGDVVIEVRRDWAPHGADRLYNLVKLGYYEDVAFFRAVEGFMVQWGIHGNPEVTKAWSMAPIKDDPVKHSNKKGTVTFAAKQGKNTRTTHLFINYRDNGNLDTMGFAPIGEVVEGMDVVRSLHTGYGEGAPQGKGPAQPEIERKGNAYLRDEFPELDYIRRAELL
jgi:peptidyl-prolyl cis-trans isomerase A (cyclophilin A)